MKLLTFGEAVAALEQGFKISRQGWDNGVISMNWHGLSAMFFFNPGMVDQRHINTNKLDQVDATILALSMVGWIDETPDPFTEEWHVVESKD